MKPSTLSLAFGLLLSALVLPTTSRLVGGKPPRAIVHTSTCRAGKLVALRFSKFRTPSTTSVTPLPPASGTKTTETSVFASKVSGIKASKTGSSIIDSQISEHYAWDRYDDPEKTPRDPRFFYFNYYNPGDVCCGMKGTCRRYPYTPGCNIWIIVCGTTMPKEQVLQLEPLWEIMITKQKEAAHHKRITYYTECEEEYAKQFQQCLRTAWDFGLQRCFMDILKEYPSAPGKGCIV